MLDDFESEQEINKHFIDYNLTNTETIDLVLTKAEAQMDSIINWREFKSLEGLDAQYDKI